MKYLAVGDQHFGAGADLGHKPGERLAEQEAVWEWTLQHAREHQVDAILHAGDWFNARKPEPEVMLAAERPLVRHRDLGGAPVISIVGNHDVSSLDSGCALDVFAEAGLIELARTPRVVLADGGARVACLPWAPVSRLAANYDGPRDLLNDHAARLLVDAARQLRNEAGYGEQPVILLTHFAISGTSLPSGLDVGQLLEPVLDQDELLAIGYDAVLAAHIHRPARFGANGLYVGSPQPLSFGESDGLVRGPWLVSIYERQDFDDPTPGVNFWQLEAPSRGFLTVDVTAESPLDPSLHLVDGFMKIRLHGTEQELRAVDVNEMRSDLEAAGVYRVFVELDVQREARARDTTVDDSLDAREALRRWLDAQEGLDPDLVARVLERADAYLSGEPPVAQDLLAAIA